MIEARLFGYLLSHKALPLQTLGVLRLVEEEAAYDVTTNQYLPPKQRMVLDTAESESVQPLMRQLAVELGETEETAFEQYQDWLQHLQRRMREEGKVAIRGLGTFSAGDPPGFEPWPVPNDLQPTSVVAHRVIKSGALRSTGKTSLVAAEPDEIPEEEQLPQGDYRWMIGAFILLLTGIALIALRSFGIW